MHALPTALRLHLNYPTHIYEFELDIHVLLVLTGLELRFSAQIFKLKSPFTQRVGFYLGLCAHNFVPKYLNIAKLALFFYGYQFIRILVEGRKIWKVNYAIIKYAPCINKGSSVYQALQKMLNLAISMSKHRLFFSKNTPW